MSKHIFDYIIILCCLITCCLSACESFNSNNAIVKIGENYLYYKEIQEILPEKITPEDSIIKVNNYIDNWIKKQLILQAAEDNLSSEYSDIQAKVEDYKNSLFIHKYKQKIIEQKLDTNIEMSEIEEYYKKNLADFNLSKNAVKCVYIKILKSDKQLSNILSWSKSSSPNDSMKLAEYCTRKATVYQDFKNEWVYLSTVISNFVYEIQDQEEFLKKRKHIDTEDETYYYILKVKKYLLAGEQAPLTFVKENIKIIILNKRERILMDEVENTLYQKALDKGKIQYFQN